MYIQSKWKAIINIIAELKDILSEGQLELERFYSASGFNPDTGQGDRETWKTAWFLEETTQRIEETASLKKVGSILCTISFNHCLSIDFGLLPRCPQVKWCH